MDKFLQSNTVMKGVALLLAFMLWLIVNMDEQPHSPISQQQGEYTMDNVAVEVIYDDELYSLMEMDGPVQVQLTGRRALLNVNQLRADPYRLYVDLTGLGPGEHRVPIQYEGIPSELQVQIMPSHVRVVLEEKQVEAFDIVIEMTGKAKEGFHVGQPSVTPEEAYVIAPERVLEQVVMVKGYMNVQGAESDMTRTASLKVYDQYGNEIEAEVSPQKVEVHVPVQSPSASIPLQVELVNELPDDLSFNGYTLLQEDIEVFAPLNVLQELREVPLTIDLSTIDRSGIIRLDVPIERDWLGTNPSQVQVQFDVSPTMTRTFQQIPLQVNGLQEGYELQFIDPSEGWLDIDVKGSQELTSELKAEDIQASIQLEGLDEGEHEVNVDVQVPEHLEVNLEDLNITVQIQQQGRQEAQGSNTDNLDHPDQEGE